jgi:glycosyltransferase involved in cell wall biosynthesis
MARKSYNTAIAVVIAALNEEFGIGPTINEILRFLTNPRLLVVDGRSIDKTVSIAKERGAEIILQDGKGKGRAIGQCIKQMDSDLRYVVFTDADYTYPAEYIPKMIEILDQNPDVGMVIGNRFNGDLDFHAVSSNLFYAGNRFLAFAQHIVNGIKLRDPLSGLRIVRWEILRGWKPRSKEFDVEAEMNYLVERRGFGIREIPIAYRRRLGEKKLKLRHGFSILRRIVAESLTSSESY